MPRRDEYDDRYEDRDRSDDRDRYDDRGRDDDYEDYEDRPRRCGGREYAAQKVSLPAIFLMVVGALGFLAAVGNAVFVLSGAADDQPNPLGGKPDPNMKNDPSYVAGQVIGVGVTVLWGAVVFFGGLQLKNLSSRGFVTFACVWAMLPCNWCCVLGIPFGIWALVAMNDPSVKRVY